MKTELDIAIVDDDLSVQRALSRVLRANRFVVRTFISPLEFLGSLRRSVPGCVILDVQMPEMSGLELYARIRSLGCAVPVIFITAHEDTKVEQLALESGAAAFLHKPIHGRILCDAIRAALGGPSERQNFGLSNPLET